VAEIPIIRFDFALNRERRRIVLDLMRRHATSWIIKVALGGIIVVFVFFFGWSGPGDKSRNYAAKVNDTVISYDYFSRIYDTTLKKLELRFGGSVPSEFMDRVNLKKVVIQGMVNQALLLQEAKRIGLFVDDGELVRDIRTDPTFQRDGRFDESMYRAYVSNIKMTPTTFEEARKQELLERQVVRLLTDSVKTDPQEVKQLWHFQNDKVALSVLLIQPEQSTEPIDPKELDTFYKENEAKYEFPPSLEIEYAVFSWQDLVKKMSISEDEAKSYYNNNPKEFIEPERVHAWQILFKIPEDATPEIIEQVRKRAEFTKNAIEGGQNFQEVAKSESQDDATADKGGDLGFFSRGTVNRDLEKVAFTLEPGKISDPIKTEQGFHLLMIEEKKPETVIDFALAKEKIEHKLLEDKARKKIGSDADDFYEQVYRNEDLAGFAKQFGFDVRKAEFVTRAGGIPDFTSDPKVMEEAFSLRTGEISRLLRVGDKFLVMKLLAKNKERIPPLDEIRKTVEQDFLKRQAANAARKKAEEILKALKAKPEDADAIAAEFGLKWEQLDSISRTAGFVTKLGGGQDVNEMLTSLSKESPLYPTPLTTMEGIAIVRLTDVVQGSDEQYAKDAEAFEKWILEVRRTEFLKGWLKLMEDKAKIDISEKL
jgi:peptidyl-prolyl cis-trans isomerase D